MVGLDWRDTPSLSTQQSCRLLLRFGLNTITRDGGAPTQLTDADGEQQRTLWLERQEVAGGALYLWSALGETFGKDVWKGTSKAHRFVHNLAACARRGSNLVLQDTISERMVERFVKRPTACVPWRMCARCRRACNVLAWARTRHPFSAVLLARCQPALRT